MFAVFVYGLTPLTTAIEVDASQVSSCLCLGSATISKLTPRSRSPSFLYCFWIQVHFIIFASCKVVDDNALFRLTNRSQSSQTVYNFLESRSLKKDLQSEQSRNSSVSDAGLGRSLGKPSEHVVCRRCP